MRQNYCHLLQCPFLENKICYCAVKNNFLSSTWLVLQLFSGIQPNSANLIEMVGKYDLELTFREVYTMKPNDKVEFLDLLHVMEPS